MTIKTMNLINEVPIQSRPRERLEHYGEKALSNHELLAILLRTGTKGTNVLSLALSMLNHFGNLYHLKTASCQELMAVSGIGRIKAIELKAAIELGMRISQASQIKIGQITSSTKAGEMLLVEMKGLQQEHVVVLFLNTKNEIIKKETIFIGGLNSSINNPFSYKFQTMSNCSPFTVIVSTNVSIIFIFANVFSSSQLKSFRFFKDSCITFSSFL